MAALGQAAADAGALVLTRTLARELRHDGQGRITAVICERPTARVNPSAAMR